MKWLFYRTTNIFSISTNNRGHCAHTNIPHNRRVLNLSKCPYRAYLPTGMQKERAIVCGNISGVPP